MPGAHRGRSWRTIMARRGGPAETSPSHDERHSGTTITDARMEGGNRQARRGTPAPAPSPRQNPAARGQRAVRRSGVTPRHSATRAPESYAEPPSTAPPQPAQPRVAVNRVKFSGPRAADGPTVHDRSVTSQRARDRRVSTGAADIPSGVNTAGRHESRDARTQPVITAGSCTDSMRSVAYVTERNSRPVGPRPCQTRRR